MRLRCLIVDDEPLALDLLEEYVQKTPFLELAGRCSNGIDALERLHEQPVDVLFLDIQMPDLSGLELSRMLDKNTRVIFTTAFEQYALEGFRVDALDYLLKPFNYEEFLRAAQKARQWFELTSAHQPAERVEVKNYLFVKSEYKQVRIELDEVLYFEGLKDYVRIVFAGPVKPILTLMSLKALEEQLPDGRFMRIHRSYIVHLDRIEAVERGQVLIANTRITVADQYRERFQAFLDSRLMK